MSNPSLQANPRRGSKSSPGVRMVTAIDVPPRRISKGSSAASVSGRLRGDPVVEVEHLTPLRYPSHRAQGIRGRARAGAVADSARRHLR